MPCCEIEQRDRGFCVQLTKASDLDLEKYVNLRTSAICAACDPDVARIWSMIEANTSLPHPDSIALICTDSTSGRYLGIALATCAEVFGQARLLGLYVVPYCQRQGIGRYLLRCLMDKLARQDVSRLRTYAFVGAEGFYRTLGFSAGLRFDCPAPGVYAGSRVPFVHMQHPVLLSTDPYEPLPPEQRGPHG